jgi:hypothetical protein
MGALLSPMSRHETSPQWNAVAIHRLHFGVPLSRLRARFPEGKTWGTARASLALAEHPRHHGVTPSRLSCEFPDGKTRGKCSPVETAIGDSGVSIVE